MAGWLELGGPMQPSAAGAREPSQVLSASCEEGGPSAAMGAPLAGHARFERELDVVVERSARLACEALAPSKASLSTVSPPELQFSSSETIPVSSAGSDERGRFGARSSPLRARAEQRRARSRARHTSCSSLICWCATTLGADALGCVGSDPSMLPLLPARDEATSPAPSRRDRDARARSLATAGTECMRRRDTCKLKLRQPHRAHRPGRHPPPALSHVSAGRSREMTLGGTSDAGAGVDDGEAALAGSAECSSSGCSRWAIARSAQDVIEAAPAATAAGGAALGARTHRCRSDLQTSRLQPSPPSQRGALTATRPQGERLSAKALPTRRRPSR